MHTWKTRIAATLAVLMLTNCISPAAFAQNTEESPQSTQVSLLSDENNADFTIEDGVLTAYTGSDTSVTIPEGVTVIGDGSSPIFGSNVESVTIPASVTAITDKAFYNCTGLTSVTFAEGSRLKTIGNEAFYAVNQLESLTIPEGVTSIGQYAFTAMNKLQTITLPGTLTKVCSGEWFGSLFGRGTSGGAPVALNSVNITEDGEQYRSYDGAVYSADGKTLIYCPAAKQSIDWLAGVEEIASYAFLKTTMEQVVLPSGLKTVAEKAFYSAKCTSLKVPESVESIGASAFYNSKVKTVSFSEGLKSIGSMAFSECYFPANTELVLPASLESVGGSAFDCLTDSGGPAVVKVRGMNTVLGSSFIPNSAKVTLFGLEGSTAQKYAEDFGDKRKLTFQILDGETKVAVESVVLPASLTLTEGSTYQVTAEILPEDAADKTLTWSSSNAAVTVDQTGLIKAVTAGTAVISAVSANGKSAACTVTVTTASDFTIEDGVLTAYNGDATEIVIPDGVTAIGTGTGAVFGNKVVSVTIPTSVTTIAAQTFYSCTGLKHVTFAEDSRLKTIGNEAFYAANQLESLTIPEGVTSIGQYAFAAMNKLQTITLPGTLTTVCGGEWFGNLFARGTSGGAPAALASVNITEGGEQYRSHDGAVYSADGKTLIYCPAAKQSIDWLDGVTAIGAYAFYNSTMPSVNIPGTVTEISANAFNRAKMTSLEIPGSIKTVGASAFFFSQLTNVTLNEGLERIENSAFSQSRVAQVAIPASVTYIGKNAFDFEYGSDYSIRLLGKNTELTDEFIPYYYAIKVYGLADSTAEQYVAAKKAEKGDSCKLTFQTDGYVEPVEIRLNQETVSLHRTENARLTAEVLPEGAQATVSWSSSQPAVATVSKDGLVTAVQQGTTVITAAVGKLTASCTVHVIVDENESDYVLNQNGEVTGYLGTDWKVLNIPAEIGNQTVTGIADGAFENQRDIQQVILPETVTVIGSNAFYGCTNLKKINLNHVTSMGSGVFRQCAALQSVALGEGLRDVPEQAFMSCANLKAVTLPSSVKELGKECFAQCTSLEALILPEGLTTIHAGALKKCPLQTLHLPASLQQLGDEYMGDVFEDPGALAADTAMKTITVAEGNPLYTAKDGLLYNKEETAVLFCPRGRTEAVIPEGVTEIGCYAFFMCFNLIRADLPSTLKTVREQAFHYCEALTDCELPTGLERVENSAFFGCEEWTGVDRIPVSVQYIGPYAFNECKGTKIVVPEGIADLPEFAFWGYEDTLTEIILPASLKTIGNSAFAWAKNVKSLTIPEGVTSVGSQSFARMDALETLTLPATLQTIGEEAFAGGENVENRLKEVYIPASVTQIGKDAFAKRTGLTIVADRADTAAAQYARANGLTLKLKNGDEIDSDFEIVNGVLVAYHGTKTEVVIPSSVTEIGPGVFESPDEGEEGVEVTKVTIPASVTKIGARAFYGCQLTEVIFETGSALREIGESAFAYCTKLPEITLPDGLEVIGVRAFDGDSRLTEIAIPASVTTIGAYAFELCSGLTSVQFASGLTSQLKTIGNFAFYQCYRLTHIEIPEGVVSIGDNALRISRGLTSVSLPSTLERLGTAAPLVFAPANESGQFSGTDDLISITVAEGNRNYSSRDGLLYTADGKTLLYCPAGRTGTVTVADGTQVIDTYAFHRSQASHVALPDGLQSIRDYGFKQSALISVELPGSVESIGNNAFFNCSALKTAQLGSGLKTIGENAFSLTRIAQVTIPAGVSSIGKNAFDFEYGGQNLFVRILGAETTLADEFIPYYYAITLYGAAGSAAEKYVATKRADKGDRCKLTFKNLDSYEAVTQVTLDKTELTLKQRETAVLGASVQPKTATHTDLVFKSLDTKIAAVSADGTVTAAASGVVTIRVISTDGPYADCRVTVTQDETISDFTVDDRGYITGYTGESGNLVIPGTVENKTVLGVASGAFQNRWDIETVTLPDSLQHIEDNAFSHCGNLSAVIFGSGLKTIGSRAFENCTHLRSLTLPEGLESLGEYAFNSCESLEMVTLPSTLRELPKGAFYICWRLKEVNIPEGVTYIGQDAFYECEGMLKLTLPTTLRTISSGAFAACVRLTEVTIPEGVETVEQQAFMSCTALTAIHLPATLKNLGSQYPGDAFERSDVLGCNHLTTVTVTEGNLWFSAYDGLLYSADGKTLLFCPRGLTSTAVKERTERIGDYAFFYCRALESLTLPTSIRHIGSNSISVCEQLRTLHLPEGLVSIGDAAFASSAALTEVNIPSTVETIGNCAFLGTALETLVLPTGVKSIGAEALAYNPTLNSVTIRSGMADIGADLCKNSPNVTIWTDSAAAPIYAYAQANGITVRLLNSGSGSSSSSGGSSSGGSSSDRDTSGGGTVKTETTKNNDGSVTKTETKKDGTKVETTTAKDGSTSKTTTNPNGSSVTENKAADGSTGTVKTDKHGQTTAETQLSGKAVETAKRNGEPVKAPIEVEATRNSDTAPTVKIELPRNSGDTKVEIPVSNVKPGTVAVLVHADGTEEIIKNSVPTEDGIQLTVNGGATVKIVDNSKDFIDTRNHWAKDEINFVASRELFKGVTEEHFGVERTMTRAMVNTVLARLAGVDTTPSAGQNWYDKGIAWARENGVSDGSNPNGSVTREQLAAMLYRYAGSPAVSGSLPFSDAGSVSDYAQNALIWATQNGILNGYADGRVVPAANSQRSQVAAMMARFIQNAQ